MVKRGRWEITDKSNDSLKNQLANIDKTTLRHTKPQNQAETPESVSRQKIIETLKKYSINQVIFHAKEYDDRGKLTFESDLDTRLFVEILENFNNKNTKKNNLSGVYAKNAVFHIIPKGGTEKDLNKKNQKGQPLYEQKDGVTIIADAGNTWIEYEETGKNKIIKLDHHGEGRKDPTSASKEIYEILKEGKLLKENPKWLEDLVEFVTDLDNLSYVKEKKDKGEWTEEYFTKTWPRSLRAIAGKIPFEVLKEWFKSGKAKKLMDGPFTDEELNGDFGNTSWVIGTKMIEKPDGSKEEIPIKKTIRDVCEEQAQKAQETNEGLKNCIEYANACGLNMRDTRVGDVIYFNYFAMNTEKGKVTNKVWIPEGMAFMGTNALGYDTFVTLNKQNKIFGINSNHPNMKNVAEDFKKEIPGTQDLRGTFIFPSKDTDKRKDWGDKMILTLIDPKITKKAKMLTILDKKNTAVKPITKEDVKTNDTKVPVTKDVKDTKENINENSTEQILDVEDEIEKLKRRIQERMDSIEVENEKLNKLKENDRVIQDKLKEVNKKLEELN